MIWRIGIFLRRRIIIFQLNNGTEIQRLNAFQQTENC